MRGSDPLATPPPASTITPEDVKKVASLPNVAAASGIVTVVNASVDGEPLSLTGVDPSYQNNIQHVNLVSGDFLKHAGEIVLDEPMAKDLLQVNEPKDAVGKTLKIGGDSANM